MRLFGPVPVLLATLPDTPSTDRFRADVAMGPVVEELRQEEYPQA